MSARCTEILLVRHGRTAWNAERRFLGRTDIPLDELGLAQARALASHPAFEGVDAVVASPLARTWHTALALSSAPSPDPDLVELHQGELEGLDAPTAIMRYAAFFEAWAADPTGVCAPGGESLDACRDRGLAALRRIVEQHRAPARVVVVTHQLLLASVCAHLAGAPLSAWRSFAVGNAGWRRLVWRDGVAEVLEGDAGAR